MCGRFSQTQSGETLAQIFQLSTVPDWSPRYNVAPTQAVPAVIHPKSDELLRSEPGDRAFRLLRWGLVPSWSKDVSIGNRLINARAESVAEKPSFRTAFKRRRCLILADGFYEWKTIEKRKQPYYFRRTDGAPFAFAGLWERWESAGDVLDTCTIITTEANSVVEAIHDRMPVMLEPADYDLWLNPETRPDPLHRLLRPYTAEAMEAYPVSLQVNRPENDRPECVKPLEVDGRAQTLV